MVVEKVSLYFSLSVVQIFTFFGKNFQDYHFFGKNCEKFAFFEEKFGRILKPQENENITFRMKGGMTMALTNRIQMKTNEKGSFRTIYSRIFIP